MTPQEQSLVLEAREVLARYLNHNPVIGSWNALIDYCHLTIANSEVERFHVLYMDNQNRLIEDVCHHTGTVDHTPVYPREILKKALLVNACALILVHNHPSGNPSPSDADVKMTEKVVLALDQLGIRVHDHIIVGAGTEFSFRANSLI